MKKIFTRFCIAIFGIGMTFMLNAQEPTIIWGGPDDPNGSFDGGLNAWTTVGVSSSVPDSAENAVWVWDADGMADGGAFWLTDPPRGPIQSESLDNGVVIFNSDSLTSGGDENCLECGPAPRPHRGELISPSIDCSNFSSVAVNFTQYFRVFDATATVEVSVDGGPWTAFTVNSDVSTNAETAPDSRLQVNITDMAAGQEDVRIKFAFEGGFYFWIIDDVSLQTLPANDLVVEDFFYPVRNFRTPVQLNDCDTMGFSMSISNNGGRDQTGVQLTAKILDESANEMFSTTEDVGLFELGRLDTFDFEELFVPDELEPGVYTVRYEVSSDSTDFFPDDNFAEELFIVTDSLFSKDVNGPGTHFRSATPPETWHVANLYQTCPYDDSGDDRIKSLFWSFSVNATDFPTLEGVTVDAWVAEVDRDVCADWDLFMTDITDPFNHPQLTFRGINNVSLSDDSPQAELMETTMFDYDKLINEGELVEGAPISSDACYFAGLSAPGEMFIGFEERLDYDPGLVSTVVVTSSFFLGGFTGGPDAAIRAKTDFGTAINGVPELPETAVSIYPNPVQDQLTVDFELETPQDVKLYISDLMGRTIQHHQLEDVVNDRWSTNTLNVQAGTYFLRVVAEEGERTLKFIKQ